MANRRIEQGIKQACIHRLLYYENDARYKLTFYPTPSFKIPYQGRNGQAYAAAAGRKGCPDLTVCMFGYFIGFELKQPGETPKPHQVEFAQKIAAARGRCYTITGVDELHEIIEDLRKTFST